MMPGVTYLPVPSITRASGGAVTFAPTAAILPSRSSDRAVLRSRARGGQDGGVADERRGPTAKGRYVLGKGSAFGADTAPGTGGSWRCRIRLARPPRGGRGRGVLGAGRRLRDHAAEVRRRAPRRNGASCGQCTRGEVVSRDRHGAATATSEGVARIGRAPLRQLPGRSSRRRRRARPPHVRQAAGGSTSFTVHAMTRPPRACTAIDQARVDESSAAATRPARRRRASRAAGRR